MLTPSGEPLESSMYFRFHPAWLRAFRPQTLFCGLRSRRGLRSRGGCRNGWRSGNRCRNRFLRHGLGGALHQGASPAGSRVGEAEGGQHEDDGNGGCHLAEEAPRPAASKDRLAGAAEDGAHVCPFSRLQQHDENQDDTGNDMNDGDQYLHFVIPLQWIDIQPAGRTSRRPDWPRRPAPRLCPAGTSARRYFLA